MTDSEGYDVRNTNVQSGLFLDAGLLPVFGESYLVFTMRGDASASSSLGIAKAQLPPIHELSCQRFVKAGHDTRGSFIMKRS